MNKYELIIAYIKNEIVKGNIKSGQKLPSLRDICEQFNCSKVTATKAYDLLDKEHVAYSIPKSGHYLIENCLKSDTTFPNKLIDFSTSSPDSCILPYDDFQHCIDSAMELYKDSLFNNTNVQGLPNLIEVLINQLQDYQIFAAKRDLFITSGSQQAINILTRMQFPNSKENVLVEQPTYQGILSSLSLNKVNCIGIHRNYDGIDFDEFEKLLKYENIKFFYTIPRFHNPTGFSYSNKDKKTILKLCEKYDVYIVEDDYLGDLEINTKSDPLYALDTQARVIYLKTFSKVLLPGLRISANVIPSTLSKNFSEFKKWNDLNTSILSQGALEIYIKNGMFNKHVKKLKKVYSERMSYLKQLTQNWNNENVRWNIPDCGFFASFELSKNIHINKFISNLEFQNVLLTDSSKFNIKNSPNSRLLRLSVSSINNLDIQRGISIILNEIND